MSTNIFDTIIDLNKSLSKVKPLSAIWLTKPVYTSEGRTVRIAPNDEIRIKNGVIVNVLDDCPATHKVISCNGNISNTVLYFELQDLETNELITLNVK